MQTFHHNQIAMKKTIHESSINDIMTKRKYGKDLTNKFNETGEYIGSHN